MCFEKHVEEPVREVSVIIEQKNVGSPKQKHFLTVFAMELADRVIGKYDREPIPQPELMLNRGNEMYVVSFSGLTRVEPKDLRTYFRDETPFQSLPYTTVEVTYKSPKTQVIIKSEP